MSLNHDNGISSNRGGAGSAVRGEQSGGQRRAQTSVVDLNNRGAREWGRNATAEIVAKYLEAARAVTKEKLGEENAAIYPLLTLDAGVYGTALSAILMCRAASKDGVATIAVHQLLIEQSATGRLPNRTATIGNQSFEIQTVAGDVANDAWWARVREAVKDHFGAEVRIEDAGANVIPAEMASTDTLRLQHLLGNAANACFTTLDRVVGGLEEPFNIGMIDRNGDQLMVRADFHPLPVESLAGLPVRSDISLTLTASRNTQGDILNGANRTLDISRIDGYMDLQYVEPQPQAPGMPLMTQRYMPRFIITQLTPLLDQATPETLLMTLSQATALSKDMAWANTFKPRINDENDLRCIGAIGYDIPELVDTTPGARGKKIQTNSPGFDNQMLYTLITKSMHQNVIYSMDVEECGDQSWLTMMFAAAADGSQAAHMAIYEATNILTNGEFAKLFNPTSRIIVNDDNRVHLGYYDNGNGERRDIRDVNFLALLNLVGDKHLSLALDYAATYDNRAEPMEQRLEKRWKIISGAMPTAVLKGYARRITFDAGYLKALYDSCSNAGLVVRSGLQQTWTGNQARGLQGAMDFGFGPVSGGMYAYSPQVTTQHGIPSVAGRWGRRGF